MMTNFFKYSLPLWKTNIKTHWESYLIVGMVFCLGLLTVWQLGNQKVEIRAYKTWLQSHPRVSAKKTQVARLDTTPKSTRLLTPQARETLVRQSVVGVLETSSQSQETALGRLLQNEAPAEGI